LRLQFVKAGPAFEELVVVVRDHRGAAARGADDRLVGGEGSEKGLGQRAGLLQAAGVGHRLAAAGLLRGIVNFTTDALQTLRRRHADIGVELVDIAGDEQADAHRSIVGRSGPSSTVPANLLRANALLNLRTFVCGRARRLPSRNTG